MTTAVATRKVNDAASGKYLSGLRDIREKIAQKEVEVNGVIALARKGSDRRVRMTGMRLDAENELEEALINHTVLKERSYAAAESLSKAHPLLKEETNDKRLRLLAASPPFLLKLEQALAVTASVKAAIDSEPTETHTRWRSALKRLTKEASDGIDRYKHLPGRGKTTKDVDSELALAAASARLLSLHVNAWSPPRLSRELERIWLQAVRAGAREDPEFARVVTEWEGACHALEERVSMARKEACVEEGKQEALATRIHDCQVRAGIRPRVEKAGWWKQREERFLWEELRHIKRKVAPSASPSYLAARYNLLLARCAEAGAWTVAVATHRSTHSRGTTLQDGKRSNGGSSLVPLEPVVYRHLLRAAKNASPPQPRAALLVLQEMRSRGREPCASHYNLVVGACARAAASAACTPTLLPVGSTQVGSSGGCMSVTLEGREAGGSPNPKKDGTAWDGVEDGDGSGGALRESVALSETSANSDGRSATDSRLMTRGGGVARCTGGDDSHRYPLSAGSTAPASRGPETAGNAWRLALEVIADMRDRGIAPTEVTYKTLVECCRCAGAASAYTRCGDGREAAGSAPADVYAALKEAEIPLQFCYQAGVANAWKGGRRFPEYVAEINRVV